MRKTHIAGFVLLGMVLLTSSLARAQNQEKPGKAVSPPAQMNLEFHGPFASWINVRDYGAAGNGKADDTEAIRKALLAALPEAKTVLYFPSGTYRITGSLDVPIFDPNLNPKNDRFMNKMIVGEEPATTILKWDGAADGVMMRFQAVHSTSIGRLTFDGGNKANICLRLERNDAFKLFSSYGRVNDIIFRNAKYGFYNTDWEDPKNDMDAEYSILRCAFRNLSEAGVRIDSGNAYDFWIRQCQFENCKFGVTNSQGDFRVMDCVFRNSTEADIYAVGHRGGGIRNNYSRGSKRFLMTRSCNMVIQNNRIVDSLQTDTIQIGEMFNCLLLDNRIRTRDGATEGPAINETSSVKMCPIVAIGNQFTVKKPIHLLQKNSIEFDNRTVNDAAIDWHEPALPSAPPRVARKIFEIIRVRDAQGVVDQAVEYAKGNPGSRPVVHLPLLGRHEDCVLTNTLVFPANIEMSLEGDISSIGWDDNKANDKPFVLLQGPSRVTVENISFYGAGHSWGKQGPNILIDNCDQAGARIWGDNLNGSVSAEKLSNAQVDLTDFYMIEVSVTGPNRPGPSRIGVFAGASSENHTGIHVKNGGRLLVEDLWYETGELDRPWILAEGKGSQPGELVVQSIYAYEPNGEWYPTIQCRDFDGRLSVISGRIVGATRLTGGAQTLYMSLMGHAPLTTDSSQPAKLFLIEGDAPAIGWLNGKEKIIPEGITGTLDQGFIREQLRFVREARADVWILPKPEGVTDVRLHRIGGRIVMRPDAYEATKK
jgi:hypothetical protein